MHRNFKIGRRGPASAGRLPHEIVADGLIQKEEGRSDERPSLFQSMAFSFLAYSRLTSLTSLPEQQPGPQEQPPQAPRPQEQPPQERLLLQRWSRF